MTPTTLRQWTSYQICNISTKISFQELLLLLSYHVSFLISKTCHIHHSFPLLVLLLFLESIIRHYLCQIIRATSWTSKQSKAFAACESTYPIKVLLQAIELLRMSVTGTSWCSQSTLLAHGWHDVSLGSLGVRSSMSEKEQSPLSVSSLV